MTVAALERLIAVTLLGALAIPAGAQDTVFYKCTDAKGNVSMQNGTPCPAGSKQEIRRIGEVRTTPVPAARPAAVAPAQPPAEYGEFVLVSGPAARRTPAAEAAKLPAPPTLWQCTTWDGTTYYGELEAPPPRCAPLEVLGIDGSPALGMGQACEMKPDRCVVVPDDQQCTAWYRRLDEAEFALRYATDENRVERQHVLDAYSGALGGSRCALQVDPPASAARP